MATAIAAALSLTACSVIEQSPEALLLSSRAKPIDVTFTAVDYETKTAFGLFDESKRTYPSYWTAHDQSIAVSMNLAEPVKATIIKDSEISSQAAFSGTFENTGAPYKFYAFSPISAFNGLSESRDSWVVTIPSEQTPTEDGLSCDEDAMLLYAVSEEMAEIPEEPVKLPFKHLTSYIRLALKGLDTALAGYDVAEATVNSVDLTFSVPVVGNWYIDASTGALTENEVSYTITVKPTITDLSKATDIWVALAPCVLDDQTLKVVVNTDKGRLSRTVTFGTRTYVAGAVNKISMDMTKDNEFVDYLSTQEEVVYQQILSASEIQEGDEVIFINDVDISAAMTSRFQNNAGLLSVARDNASGFTYGDDGYIRLPENSTVAVMTVESYDGDIISFKIGDNYLSISGNKGNYYPRFVSSSLEFYLHDWEDTTYALYFAEAINKQTYIYSLHFNGTYFYYDKVQYTEGQQFSLGWVAMFKKVVLSNSDNEDPDTDPIIENAQFGAYLKKYSDILHTPNVTQLSREYTGNKLTFSILFPDNNLLYEFSGIPSRAAKGDTFTLSLTKVAGRRHTDLGTFDVTVIKEQGAKLWLSDRQGNGFIVKR